MNRLSLIVGVFAAGCSTSANTTSPEGAASTQGSTTLCCNIVFATDVDGAILASDCRCAGIQSEFNGISGATCVVEAEAGVDCSLICGKGSLSVTAPGGTLVASCPADGG